MLNCTTGGHGEPPAAGQTAGCSPPPSYLEHEKANVEGGGAGNTICSQRDSVNLALPGFLFSVTATPSMKGSVGGQRVAELYHWGSWRTAGSSPPRRT